MIKVGDIIRLSPQLSKQRINLKPGQHLVVEHLLGDRPTNGGHLFSPREYVIVPLEIYQSPVYKLLISAEERIQSPL